MLVLSDFDINNNRIRNVNPAPSASDEAVPKSYVDNLGQPGTVTRYSGTGATGNVDIVTVVVNSTTDVVYWIVDLLLELPGNLSQAGILHMKGYHSRGTGLPSVGSVVQVAESIAGSPSLLLVVSGANVSLRLTLGAATGISWRAIVRRLTWAQAL